jgi:Xaa-Pro aminopeptidase
MPAADATTQPRLAQLRDYLAAESNVAFLTCDSSNIFWLTGWQQVFDSEPAHAALVSASGAWIHSDGRYSNTMRERNNDGTWDISDERITHAAFVRQLLQQLCSTSSCGQTPGGNGSPCTGAEQDASSTAARRQAPVFCTLAIEDSLALRQYRALLKELSQIHDQKPQLLETRDVILRLRAVKDAGELALIRKAQAITDAAFAHLVQWLRCGVSELEVAAELEHFMRLEGADGLAFPSIVASGPNSANPHAVPTQRLLQDGDLVVLDFGARLGGYCSDMTRTVCMGTPTSQQRQIYDVVLAAHEAGKQAIAAGVAASAVHNAAAAVIDEAGFGQYFVHSLGHGVGIDIHEQPTLHAKSNDLLAAGNVVTVEPGIYLPGVGGVRIEDFGVVRPGAGGFEDFTASPHGLITI